MWPDRVSNPGPLTQSGALPTALRGPAPRNSSVVRLNDSPDMTRCFYHTVYTMVIKQQQNQTENIINHSDY